jgi:DNA processing protein
MEVISYEDSLYPPSLRELKWPPPALFCEGNIELLSANNIAVVGTRRMTAYGEKVTKDFVRDLVKNKWCIVSGLARGVDRVAHETTLTCKGNTIAVLAHGLHMTYPPEHATLRRRIVAEDGLIVSEYPTGEPLTKQRLALRNRIVVGLSRCVLVTESPKSSGTKITVGWAAEQGKDVYVVPGPIGDPTYEGSVELMREGCIPVSNAKDIMAT